MSFNRERQLQTRKHRKNLDDVNNTVGSVPLIITVGTALAVNDSTIPAVTDRALIEVIEKENVIETDMNVTIGHPSLNELERCQTDIINKLAMKSNDPLNKSNICRGCLTEHDILLSIFDRRNDVSEPLKYNEMIMNFSNTKINENDALPSKICNICIQKTIMAYSFMLQVQASEQTLRNYLEQSKSDIPQDVAQESGLIYLIDAGEKSESIIINEASGIDDGIIEKQEMSDTQNENIISDSDLDFDTDIEKKYAIRKKKLREIKRAYRNQMKSKKSKRDRNSKMLPKTGTDNQCQICEKHFPDPVSLKEHFIFCINNPTIVMDASETSVHEAEIITSLGSCSECNVKFETSAELELHKKTIHYLSSLPTVKALSGKNIYKMVQPAIRNSKRLQEREENPKCLESSIAKENIKNLNCDICGSLFDSQESFKDHLMLHTHLGEAVCVYCLDKFEGKSELIAHVRLKHNPKKSFRCNYCASHCKSEASLEVHIRAKHTRERVLQCPICPKRFVEVKDLNRHRIAHQAMFPCPICEKTFTFKSSLKIHIPKHSRVGTKSCLECTRTFKDEFQLERHVRVMHSGETHECPQCLKVFSHISRLTQHQLSHKSEEQRRFKCSHCPKRFNHIHHLRNHERIHTGARPFLCSICGRSFVQSHDLTVHLRQHEATKPYACQLCDRTFTQPQTLMRHVRIHTGEKPFMCNLCGKCYSDNATLKRHLKAHKEIVVDREDISNLKVAKTVDTESHTAEMDDTNTDLIQITNRKKINNSHYICKVCGESFPSAITLGVHKRTHTCKYICDICNRKFSLPSTLESHRKSHPDGQRKFACSECGMSYRRPEHLRSHTRRAHSQDRPYSCPHCPAKFCQSGELNVHVRRHTGEKPYVCTYCRKAFAASTALTLHVRTHTGEKPYRCSICSRGFSTSTGMIGHMKTHVPKFKEYTHDDTNTLARAKIDNYPPMDLVNKSVIKEQITSVSKSVNISNEDTVSTVESRGEFLQKKIYLVNENDEVTVMETVASYDEGLNQYIDTDNHVDDIIDTTEYNNIKSHGNMPSDLGLPGSNIREKNDAMRSYNILRSVDGKFTLHLPGNMRLNDGDSLKIDMGNNMDLGDGTHILQLDQPLELAGDLTVANPDGVACDENVTKQVDVISSINFEYMKYANERNELQLKELANFNRYMTGRKNKAEKKAIHSDRGTEKNTNHLPPTATFP